MAVVNANEPSDYILHNLSLVLLIARMYVNLLLR